MSLKADMNSVYVAETACVSCQEVFSHLVAEHWLQRLFAAIVSTIKTNVNIYSFT